QVVEDLAQRALVLGRAVDVEAGPRAVDRYEERQALHVVPVHVGHEGAAPEGAVGGEGLTPEPQAGADVEDDGVLAGDLERHARGVAPVAPVRLAWARGRTPHAVEGDVQLSAPRVTHVTHGAPVVGTLP